MSLFRPALVLACPVLVSACSVSSLINEVETLTDTVVTTATTLITNTTNAPVRASSFSTQSGAFAAHTSEIMTLPTTGGAAFSGNAVLAHTGPASAAHVAHIGLAEIDADFAAQTISGQADGFASNVITQAQYDALVAGTWALVPGLFVDPESLEGELGTLTISGGRIDASGTLSATIAGSLDDGTDQVTVGGGLTGQIAGAEADSLSLEGSTDESLTVTFSGGRDGIFQIFASQ